MRLRPAVLLVAVSLFLGASAAVPLAADAPPGKPWASASQRDHPLAGRIWRPSEKRFVEAGEVVAALRQATFVLLGEKHDNVDHHRIQAWLIRKFAESGRRPAVAFEQFTTKQEKPLADYLAAHPRDAAGLGAALGWKESGWPDWSMFEPIVQAALEVGAPILAASLPRKTVRKIAHAGVASLTFKERRAFGLANFESPEITPEMREHMIRSHCGALPESMMDRMVLANAIKDARMAEILIRGAQMPGRDGAILIAGGGHARLEYAVPWHLRRLAPKNTVRSLALIEVEEGVSDPADYMEERGEGLSGFDFVWFTPRLDETDPCEEFAEQLRRARERE
jgi:uncharacterized iron-regulated protein